MNSALKKILMEHSASSNSADGKGGATLSLGRDFKDHSDEHEKESDDGSDHGQWGDRMSKCRERNREHAKKTRLRKKIGIDGMKKRLLQLQNEAILLQNKLEESTTANILLHMHDTSAEDVAKNNLLISSALLPASIIKGNLIDQLRSSVRSETAIRCDSNEPSSGGGNKRHRSSSVGMSDDSDGDDDCDDMESVTSHHSAAGNEKSSSASSSSACADNEQSGSSNIDKNSEEFHTLRKERNRVHAKLTRDRKKIFTSRMQQMIAILERQNNIIRYQLMRTNENLLSGSFDSVDNQTYSSSASSQSFSSGSSAHSAINYFGQRFDPFINHYPKI